MHSPNHHRGPCGAVFPGPARRPDRVQQRYSIVSRELEAGAFIDGVIEAARGPDHRRSTVAEAVNLVESAWLIAAGHEENVGAGLDPMRKRVVVAEEDGNSVGKRFAESPEQVFPFGLAVAEGCEIDVVL